MISILYTCRDRPNLSELCLKRAVDLFPETHDYEIILAYDGGDMDYVKRLLSVYEFDHIVMNPKRKVSRFELINKGLDASRGDYFMHLENDFYWSKPGAIESALEAFSKVPKLDFVRFEILPFWRSQCTQTVQLANDELCLVPKSVRFRFNFNPHLRKSKYPIGRFPPVPIGTQAEGWFADMYNERDFEAGCLMGENFRHLGIYDEHGFYKTYYAERFTLVPNEKEIDPWYEFQKFSQDMKELELFRAYLDRYGKSKLVIVAFDGIDYSRVLRDVPELKQVHCGMTSLKSLVENGGSQRGCTSQIFSTFLTGLNPDVHGVGEKIVYDYKIQDHFPTFLGLVDSVAVDVPCYNTHPDMQKIHRGTVWAFGLEAHRQQLGMEETEYRNKVHVYRNKFEKNIIQYLNTFKMDRVREALAQDKSLTMLYFWFSDVLGHMGYLEDDKRTERMYQHVLRIFKKIKELSGDRRILVMSDHGMKRGSHNIHGAFWSVSDSKMLPNNSTPEMREWYNIIKRWVT